MNYQVLPTGSVAMTGTFKIASSAALLKERLADYASNTAWGAEWGIISTTVATDQDGAELVTLVSNIMKAA